MSHKVTLCAPVWACKYKKTRILIRVIRLFFRLRGSRKLDIDTLNTVLVNLVDL